MLLGTDAVVDAQSFPEKALDWVGDIAYVTDDYTIKIVDGKLVVDRSTRPPATTPQGALPGAGIFESLGRVHPYVWIGVGALALLTIARR